VLEIIPHDEILSVDASGEGHGEKLCCWIRGV